MIFQKVTGTPSAPKRLRNDGLRISKLGSASEPMITIFQFRTNLEVAECMSTFDYDMDLISVVLSICTYCYFDISYHQS